MRLETIVAWTAQHGRLPSQEAIGGAPELDLGNWLYLQARQLTRRRLPDDRLRAQLPGWRPYVLHHVPFNQICFQESDFETTQQMLTTADALVAFQPTHQRMPRCGKTVRDAYLGVWLRDRRGDLVRVRLNADIKVVLDAQLLDWRDAPEVVREQREAWQEMLGRVQQFVLQERRLPRAPRRCSRTLRWGCGWDGRGGSIKWASSALTVRVL